MGIGNVFGPGRRAAAKKVSTHIQFLLDAGADYVIVTNAEDLAESVMAITSGTGVSIIFDPVAGPLLEKLADTTAAGATIFEYGALSPEPTTFPLFPSLQKGLTIRAEVSPF